MPASTTSVSLQVCPETAVSPDLDQAIRELLCVCFPADREVFAHTRAWHGSAPEYTVVAHAGTQLVGHIGVVAREVSAGAERTPVVGVQNFCVHPSRRGTGLSHALMGRAIDEATARGMPFGLLFCVPELERFYAQLGWRIVRESVTMCDEHGATAPVPDKNICMALELAGRTFPAGRIDLRGRDW